MGFVSALLLGFLVGFVLVLLFVIAENKRSSERQRLMVATATLSTLDMDDVRKIFSKQCLPQWILFTEYEKLSWVNQELKKLWPFVDKAASELARLIMEPKLAHYRPQIISSTTFQKFTLGTVAPQLTGIRLVETNEEEIVMEVEAQWDGNPSIILAVKTKFGVSLPIQVKDVAVTGVFRVVFKPLVEAFPCFGALMYSLREEKRLDFKLKVVGGDVKAFPVVAGALDAMIRTAVTDSFLWPMRQVVPVLSGDYSDLQLRSSGKLEVKLVQAKDLLNMDLLSKSDPFAEVYIRPIRSRMKRSRTKNNDLNPVWNEHFEFEVEDPETQSLTIDVFDEDNFQASERIGSTAIPLNELQPGRLTELWLPLLKDVKNSSERKYRGQVQVELLYRPFDENDWEQKPVTPKQSSLSARKFQSYTTRSKNFLKNATFHYTVSPREQQPQQQCGVLVVDVLRGDNLAAKDLNGLSDPFVVLRMQKSNQQMKTKVIRKTLHPEWNERFEFAVNDPVHDMLLVQVRDHDLLRTESMGSCALTLSKVLHEGACEEVLQLGSEAAGRIHLRLEWKPKL